MKKQPKIKPCPFCGGGIETIYFATILGDKVAISCPRCLTRSTSYFYNRLYLRLAGFDNVTLTKEEATRAAVLQWNARNHRQYKRAKEEIKRLVALNRSDCISRTPATPATDLKF